MVDTQRHRGPDDRGVWLDEACGVALGHTRLAIIDPTPDGCQPMASHSGRHVVVYNGEIYNFRELRAQLEGEGQRGWRGHSDTEVLVEAFETWGVADTLERVDGMFALAMWDRQERRLTLARDRFGEKPLFYGYSRGTFLFGSELKAIQAHPDFEPVLDRGAIALYMRYGYVPAPYSIFAGISKLPPSGYVELGLDDLAGGRMTSPSSYWSLEAVAAAGEADPHRLSEQEAIDSLDHLLEDSVRSRMVADVPLGAFLSGGLDSTAIVAKMQQVSSQPVRTFTIGNLPGGYDEAPHAAAVARHLGTEHTALEIKPSDALALVPRLPVVYDEPFADSSQIPTMLVSEMTRKHVTVALTGDAGDELFGGYARYLLYRRVWDRLGWVPSGVRRGLASGIRAMPDRGWDRIEAVPAVTRRISRPREKARKLADVLPLDSPEQMYHHLMSQWQDPAAVVIGATEPPTRLAQAAGSDGPMDPTQRLLLIDALSYLPDDILAKVDRAAMAYSLETRLPFLAPSIVEFAWRLPLDVKIRAGEGKWILRQVVDRYVPRALMERPKMGFGIPVGEWLRGPLRDWAEDLLDADRLEAAGYLRPEPVREVWAQHLAGIDRTFPVWTVLMFQAWYEQLRTTSSNAAMLPH
jgi:asparagine synthase (glutamine-hydrolysing)